MWQMISHFLMLVFLTGRAATLGKSTDSALECGEERSCAILTELMSTVNAMNDQLGELNVKLNKQANGLEELKTDLNKSLVSTAAISTHLNEQLNKQAKDLEGLKTDLNKSLASTAAISTQLNVKLEKQAKDLEELKTNVKKGIAAISTQLGSHSTDLLSHDGRLKTHDVSHRNEYQLAQSIYGAELGPRDCSDIKERGYNASGVYRVYPGSDYKRIETDVYCDFQNLGQSWLVFQRRKDGSVNFERLWKDYANGFGNLNAEFWLGNEKLSLLTMNRKYKLRIELEDFTGQKRYAEYSTFSVRPVTDKYRLTVGGYSGNAGDSLGLHNNHFFSTKDVDNDKATGNCAQQYRGAWWYNNCHHSNLNGFYLRGSHTTFADGVEWKSWLGFYYSLKATAMKIMAVY